MSTNQIRVKSPIFLAVLMSLTLFACSGGSGDAVAPDNSSQNNATPSAEIPSNGPVYIVSTDPSNAPFEMRGEGGEIVGLDMDLLHAIAKQEGINYEIKPRAWQGILDTLETGESDVVTGVVVHTEERAKKYDFTDPVVYKKRYAYLTNETVEKHQVKSFADICSLKVAVKAETDKAALYESVCGQDNPNMVAMPSSYGSLREMISGNVDVAIGDDVLFNYYLRESKVNNVVKFANEGEGEIILAWPVRKGNNELLNKLNNGLRSLKADGRYDQIKKKWLGE